MREPASNPDQRSAEDRTFTEEMLPLVYDELRRLAAHKMATEAAGHTLQPTALVHERVDATGQHRCAEVSEPHSFLRRVGGGDAAHPHRTSARRRLAAKRGAFLNVMCADEWL